MRKICEIRTDGLRVIFSLRSKSAAAFLPYDERIYGRSLCDQSIRSEVDGTRHGRAGESDEKKEEERAAGVESR